MATGRKNTIVLSAKINSDLPQFRVLETEEETYIICLEARDVFKCFSTLDAPGKAASRKRLKIVEDKPLIYNGELWDDGHYAIGSERGKLPTEYKLLSALDDKEPIHIQFFGTKLHGNFTLDWDKKLKAWYLKKNEAVDEEEYNAVAEPEADEEEPEQNIKDDEDVQESQAKIPGKAKAHKVVSKAPHHEESTINTSFTNVVGGYELTFDFYKSIHPGNDEVICVITGTHIGSFLMQQTSKSWQIKTAVSMDIARLEVALSDAIQAFLHTGT